MLETETLPLLAEAVAHLDAGYKDLPPFTPAVDLPAARAVLLALAERLRDTLPYPHPLYVGQMIKPPHPVARAAYALAQQLNPNNHALDGGRATSALEREAVATLAATLGLPEHLGHLTSGGTVANLEALWVATRLAPGKVILASDQAHYTHSRLSAVLGAPFEALPTDDRGALALGPLEARLARGDVGLVVATLGTTALGAVDPLAEILALAAAAPGGPVRVHGDAAYGGYFRLARGLAARFAATAGYDSLAIDPHKHGLQPYGCGAVRFRDPSVGRFYRHDSPYTYFTSAELHLGEISLECSRPGAAAAALWATHQLLPPVPGGAFAAELEAALAAAGALRQALTARGFTVAAGDLDIVVAAPTAGASAPLERLSARSRAIFEAAADRGLHLALATLPARFFPGLDAPPGATVTALRACVMRPEHGAYLDEILARLDAACAAAPL